MGNKKTTGILYNDLSHHYLYNECIFYLRNLSAGEGLYWSRRSHFYDCYIITWNYLVGNSSLFCAALIVKPLQKLEVVALQAAQGDISENIELAKADNEIRSLGMAFNQMLENLRDMVHHIDDNFKETNKKVEFISY